MEASFGAGFSIRAVTDADAEEIAAFFAAAHAEDPVVGAIAPDAWRRFASLPQNRGGRDFRFVTANGEIAGVATPALHDREAPWIRNFRIVVAPAQRRRGIGSALLREIATMDAPHPALLQCLCPERWEALAAFLETCRFAAVEHELEMVCADAGRHEPRRRHDIAVRALDGRLPLDAGLAEALAAIHNRAYAGTAAFVRRTGAEMAAAQASALVIVAERRGAALGFCEIEPAGDATWIETIAVDPREQGRGVGLLLLQHALAEAARRAGPRVRLAVSDRSAAAYALYRRAGFDVVAKSARYRAERARVLLALEGAGR